MIVHVSSWALEVSIPHVKYVITSRVALVLPKKSHAKTFIVCLFVTGLKKARAEGKKMSR